MANPGKPRHEKYWRLVETYAERTSFVTRGHSASQSNINYSPNGLHGGLYQKSTFKSCQYCILSSQKRSLGPAPLLEYDSSGHYNLDPCTRGSLKCYSHLDPSWRDSQCSPETDQPYPSPRSNQLGSTTIGLGCPSVQPKVVTAQKIWGPFNWHSCKSPSWPIV